MNLAIIGYGRMGKSIERLLDTSIKLRLVVDPAANNTPCDSFSSTSEINQNLLDEIDIFMDFTSQESSKNIILSLLERKEGARIVSGTTGWDAGSVKSMVIEKNAHFLHSANFSIGINVISTILPTIAKSLSHKDFDASIVEYHHKNKKDSPSGTAKVLAKLIEDCNLKAPISSIRSGHYSGTHTISFDSVFENIEIKHTARSRDVFCIGAILAAKWLAKQNKPAVYTFSDVINDTFK